MGFTGTPLIAGEELTRQQFGDYVSVYNFSDAIKDGATVTLYCENRIPELQLVNEDFPEELADLLDEADLDEEAEGQLARRFGREYMLLSRPERLKTVANDLVRHFVGRGFTGKAMYVGIDKAAAVRMYDYVREAWAEYLLELRAQHDALPELERPWLASRIALMEKDLALLQWHCVPARQEFVDETLGHFAKNLAAVRRFPVPVVECHPILPPRVS